MGRLESARGLGLKVHRSKGGFEFRSGRFWRYGG